MIRVVAGVASFGVRFGISRALMAEAIVNGPSRCGARVVAVPVAAAVVVGCTYGSFLVFLCFRNSCVSWGFSALEWTEALVWTHQPSGIMVAYGRSTSAALEARMNDFEAWRWLYRPDSNVRARLGPRRGKP